MMTGIAVGSRTLASYDYGTQNGNLRSMTYGNGTTVSYTYDILDRVTEEKWNGTLKYRYVYSSDGYLAKKLDVTTGKAVNYECDSLDRLIHSCQTGAVSGALHPTHCFGAGTAIAAAAGYVAIETLKPGDWVWAWDEETGDVALKPVKQLFVNETDELIHLTVNGKEITTTPTHPFYVAHKGWYAAVDLRAGDILVLVNGEYVTLEKTQHEILEAPITVYNFEVEDYHTYYVGTDGVLVHNSCGGETAATKRGRQMHKEWDYGPGTIKEYRIPGYGRADAVDLSKKIVYELKPNNPRAIRRGMKQLQRYATGLSKMYPNTRWITKLVTY